MSLSRNNTGRALLLTALLIPATTRAATITVTTTADTTANDGQCSLREAIVAANTNAASGAAAGECPAGSERVPDIVVLTRTTYDLTNSVPDATWGATGLPTVTSAITIQGNGATIRRASGVFRIARVDTGGTLTLDRVTIRDGRVGNAGSANGYGAGLLNLGTLSLTNRTVVRNNAIRLNGSAWWGSGGGIYSSGTLTVTGSTISHNLVDVTSGSCSRAVGGGLFSGDVATITDSVITANRASGATTGTCTPAGWGGGIATEGDATIARTAIFDNEASVPTGAGLGGGLHVLGPTLTIDRSSITGNTASGSAAGEGGGIFLNVDESNVTTVSNTTISDNNATGASGSGGGGIAISAETLQTSASLVLVNATVANNRADGFGGGLFESSLPSSFTATNSIIAGNQVGGSLTDATADCSISSAFAGSGHNLVSRGTGCHATHATDRRIDPSVVFTNVLDPLGTASLPTHALRMAAGNPAVDAGDAATCAAVPIGNLDQLGAARPVDGSGDGAASCDIGAVELQAVLPAISVTTSASVVPSTATAGGTTTIIVSVTSTLSQALLVDVEVYDASDAQVYQSYLEHEPFTAGVPREFLIPWALPVDLAPGTYTVKIGIFGPVLPTWDPLFVWNNGAATLTVN